MRLEALRRQRSSRLQSASRRKVHDGGGTVEPMEVYLIHGLPVVKEMVGRIQMGPLVGRQGDLRKIVADGIDGMMNLHADRRVFREDPLPTFKRM